MKSAISGFIFLLFLGSLSSCTQKQNPTKLGDTELSEEEFYGFLNQIYSEQKFAGDSVKLFGYAGNSIAIPYENGAPTVPEPPPSNVLDASYRIDSSRFTAMQIISKQDYSKAMDSVSNIACQAFKTVVGKKLLFIHLPWFNVKDETLLFCEVPMTCPPEYHQGQGVYYRYKKVDDHWVLID